MTLPAARAPHHGLSLNPSIVLLSRLNFVSLPAPTPIGVSCGLAWCLSGQPNQSRFRSGPLAATRREGILAAGCDTVLRMLLLPILRVQLGSTSTSTSTRSEVPGMYQAQRGCHGGNTAVQTIRPRLGARPKLAPIEPWLTLAKHGRWHH